MTRFFSLLCLLLLTAPAQAQTSPLVGDISNYRIEIDSGFNGTRLFLFGTRNDSGDVVVVVRGPQRTFIVRQKERIAGMWLNRRHMTFRDVPDYYAIAASKPLESIKNPALLSQLRLGTGTLIVHPMSIANPARFSTFSEAFLRSQQGRKLYTKNMGTITFMGETLFKTTITFPDTIPPGNYTAELYLLSDGELTGMQSIPIQVIKSGFDAFITTLAHVYPALYGLLAVLIALSAGWFAGKLFDRV